MVAKWWNERSLSKYESPWPYVTILQAPNVCTYLLIVIDGTIRSIASCPKQYQWRHRDRSINDEPFPLCMHTNHCAASARLPPLMIRCDVGLMIAFVADATQITNDTFGQFTSNNTIPAAPSQPSISIIIIITLRSYVIDATNDE